MIDATEWIKEPRVYTPPNFVPPCAPVTGNNVPTGEVWLHEPMIEGYRFQIVKDGQFIRLYSASGQDLTKRLLSFAQAFRWLSARSAVLDGLIVVPDADRIQYCRRELAALHEFRDVDLIFFAFDLLHHDGNDLKVRALLERKRQLARLVARSRLGCLHLVHTSDDGADLIRRCEAIGLGGIVSKRRGAPYRSGTSGDWVAVARHHVVFG